MKKITTSKICPCRATDKQLRELAKYLKISLKYLRDIKKLHNKYRKQFFFSC